ncbi:MAG: hypothetical protein GF333_07720 [Candidatus Omnitrophica bacterium]|nr:hypothetical protein [Candidatus Omnitrophota bacterium]
MTFSYTYLDSQRLKDAFFSAPSRPPRNKKPFWIGAGVFLGIALIVLVFSHYQFFFIPRKLGNSSEQEISLLHKGAVFRPVRASAQRFRKRGRSAYIALPSKGATGVTVTFASPVNLNTHRLAMVIQKSEIPIHMELVLRDTQYHSNSLYPVHIDIPEKELTYVKVPITLANAELQNTNITRTSQLKVFVSRLDSEAEPVPVSMRREQEIEWVLVKDLVLAKKEGE